MPRVAVCPTKVGYGGQGKRLPEVAAILHKTGCVAVATHLGTMTLRAVEPEAEGPVKTKVLWVGAPASAPGVDVFLVKPVAAVETKGASDIVTLHQMSRQQAPKRE